MGGPSKTFIDNSARTRAEMLSSDRSDYASGAPKAARSSCIDSEIAAAQYPVDRFRMIAGELRSVLRLPFEHNQANE